MLGWLAGHRPPDSGLDPDTTAVTEGPETPAPVFAVRAFKHAIFGTPQTQQLPKPRRHSATDSPNLQIHTTRPSRPNMIRPKSWHDAQPSDKEGEILLPEPLPSPTKGILVTPGTAAARRKTVSFGDQVIDNETKRVPKSGLPGDIPGKFPSPWVKPVADHLDNGEEETAGKSKVRNKLTEALEQARDDSARRKNKVDRPLRPQDEAVSTTNTSELLTDSARYWKQEYDIYRENTTREVKKLVAKQKAAKSFARDKDIECAELRAQLQLEQRKASLLEKRTAELEAQLTEFQEKLRKSHAEEHQAKQEIGQLRRQNSTLGGARPTFAEQIDATKGEQREQRMLTRPRSAVLQTSLNEPSNSLRDGSAPQPSRHEVGQMSTQGHSDVSKTRIHSKKLPSNKQENQIIQPKTDSTVSQIGVPSLGRKSGLKLATQPSSNATAANAVQQDTRSIAMSMGLQPPSPIREPRQDSPMHSPDWQRASSNDPPIKASEQTLEEPRFNGSDITVANDHSSPFMPDAASERPANNASASPIAAKAAARIAAVRPTDTKENIAATFQSQDMMSKSDSVKPSTAWYGLTAELPNTGALNGKRFVSKNGREVGADRIAAAQARILARGRQVS